MRFTYPVVLWALVLVPLLGLLLWSAHARRQRALAQFAGPLAEKLAKGLSPLRRALKGLLLLGAVASLIVACARPRFGTRLEEVHRKGLDIVIGLDVSNSMLAEDIQPNRLARAKLAIEGLIERLQGDRIGLVAFAGIAFTQCPLTTDYAAARMLLEAMAPDLIPVGGTDLAQCIRTAMSGFNAKELHHKVLILITDGEDTGGDLEEKAAAEAAKAGVKIYTIGVGRTDGQPIPVRDASGAVTGYRKDAGGQVVRSKLNVAGLQKIAKTTGGRFFQATLAQKELADILADIQGLEKRELSSRKISHMEDRFQIFVMLALILLALEAMIPERARDTGEWGGRFA
jgi:Ca-activated chloride channel family protein